MVNLHLQITFPGKFPIPEVYSEGLSRVDTVGIADDFTGHVADDGIAAPEGSLVAVVEQAQAELAEFFPVERQLFFRAKGLEPAGRQGQALAIFPQRSEETLAEAAVEVIEAEGGLLEAMSWVLVAEVGGSQG